MTTTKKIELSFNETEYKKAIQKYTSIAESLTKAEILSQAITDNELKSYKLVEVEAWLKNKTGFASAEYSAKTMDKINEFNEYKAYLSTFDVLDDKDIQTMFKTSKNGYLLSPEFIENLKEINTQYLKEKFNSAYEKLSIITNLLNDIEAELPNSSTRIGRLYNGIYFVDGIRLNNIDINF